MLDKPQSIVEHLTELRSRIIKAVLWVVVCVTVAMVFAHRAFTFLMSTATTGEYKVLLVQHTFGDTFMTEFRLAVIGGLILAFPFVLYQLIAFVLPALHPNERGLLYVGLPFATFMFVLGWSFGWFVVVPLTKGFFLDLSSSAGIQNQITPGSYIDYILGICNPLGIAFELPLVVLILARIGLVSATFLGRIRKYAFLGIMVIAAILSPPDIISMMIFLVPLYGLYEFSIVLARFAGKARKE
ncbi:MAG TPA: twin-arginine translocase subunit TatC [Symbiobacteriaceae bacterium]|jgi:sec-independent protein translocase protein TatC|nr:twin-arginine translocase subunit TatC [Symbiobacteriaceae bacterium]